jgi:stage II sporulation protein D
MQLGVRRSSNRRLTWAMLLLVGAIGACRGKNDMGPAAAVDAGPEQILRVLLLNNARDCRLAVNSPFEATLEADSGGGNAQKRRFQSIERDLEIAMSDGTIRIGCERIEGKEILIEPDGADFFSLNGTDYRGTLRLVVNEGGDSFDAVNYIGLESYLAGVVGAEMPNYWEPEALKAQTIAARTYCLYIKKRFGSQRSWDLGKTQAHQVYRGMEAESPQVRSAVNNTKGKVLVCRQDDAGEGIFPCYYCSACGGHTENSKHVFGDSFAPLVGVACPYCMDAARPKYYFWPTARFDGEEVSEKLIERYPKLQELGKITDITASEQSDFGQFSRLTRIRLAGTAGKTDSVRAEDLRLTIDPNGSILRSTICEISKSGSEWVFRFGRGFGHGVGMCQCGAQAMARQGGKAEQILEYYYPNSRIAGGY